MSELDPYIQLPRVPLLTSRQDLILEKCRGKRVLHLGCVDTGVLHERFERGELMHQKLAAVTGELWGVDINAEGISFLSQQGFPKLYAGDVCELGKVEALRGQCFDVILATEVMEHVQNPGLFLESVRALMIPSETEFILTVPNAFRIATLLWLLRGVEYVHPDHNYWFSYLTATNLLRKNNFNLEEIYVYTFQSSQILPSRLSRGRARAGEGHVEEGEASPPARRSLLGRASMYFKTLPRRMLASYLFSKTPFWGDGLILVAKTA